MFLNWLDDPILLDQNPTSSDKWVTANDLLAQEWHATFILPTGHLQLYPIMIRKNDFIAGERILQSFPYIILDEEWCASIRKQTLRLAENVHQYFRDSNANRTIRSWQKKIIDYLEHQQRLPFPIFRLVNHWETFFQGKQFVRFQSARGEDFQLPLFLSEALAYLTGVVMGDGHLAEYFVNIIDSSKRHIEQLATMFEYHFHTNIEFFEQTNANAWNVNVLGKWIVRFFNFLSGQPINERKYPSLFEPLLFQTRDLFRRAFWRGLMDADGSYKTTIGFGTASKQLLDDFSNFLKFHKIEYRFYKQNIFGSTTHSLVIAGQSRKVFAKLVGSNHPTKQQELANLLKRKINRFTQNSVTLQRQGFWEGQILGVDNQKLVNGFFYLNLVPNFSIANLGSYLISLRNKHDDTQKTLASRLIITQTLLSKYERDFFSNSNINITDIINKL